MKKSVLMGLLVGTPIALLGGLFVAYSLNVPQPAGANELYDHQYLYPNPIVGDRLVGGGYIFPQGEVDLWMRVRVTKLAIDQPLGTLSVCSPESFKKIHAWFLEQATAPQKLFGVVPTSGTSQVDELILKDINNLRCGDTGNSISVDSLFGKPPLSCSTNWVLYHSPSRFYYRRFACND